MGLERGADVFSFDSGMAALESGCKPVPLSPPIRGSGSNTRSHIFYTSDGKAALSMFVANVSNLNCFNTCDHTCLSGPYTPTSKGCRRCTVWGGNV